MIINLIIDAADLINVINTHIIMIIKLDFKKRLIINGDRLTINDDRLFISNNRFNDDLIEIINSTFNNLIICYLFNVFL